MKVTIESIDKFNPCKSGRDNLIKHYGDKFNMTMEEFLSIENVSYDDKVWYATKVINIKTLQQWSVECAEFVLDNFESVYPNNTRVRDCLEVIKRFLVGEATREELSAAESAVYSAAYSAAGSVARSAAESVARSAARSAYSAARSARSAARVAVVYSAEKQQEDINLSLLIALVDNEEII